MIHLIWSPITRTGATRYPRATVEATLWRAWTWDYRGGFGLVGVHCLRAAIRWA